MTVEERLEALEKEVQRLKDVQAIKELKSKYFRALDTKNWDELETTMTPNISTAYSNGKLVFHGPKEITNYFKESMPHTEITLHQGHNPVIWFESDTVAYGKWYLQDNLIFAEGNPYCGTQTVYDKLEKAAEYGTAVAGVWCQDWEGRRVTAFGKQLQWNWEWDSERYPELDKKIWELKARGVRFLGYINPFLAIEKPLYAYAAKQGYCVKDAQGNDYLVKITTFPAAMVDLTNPEAYEWIKSVIKKNMIDFGLDGWMADFGEYLPTDCVLFSGENAEKVHNSWPARWAKVNREALEETGKLGEIFFFTRAGYTDTVKYSTLMWAGDQHTDWTVDFGLPSVIPASLSLSMCGFGLTHSDIGGYTTFAKMRRNPELFMRWAEMNAFSPLMRSHEGSNPDLNAQFDANEQVLAHHAKFSRIHRALKPYLIDMAALNAERGIPVTRPLFYHYDGERERKESTEYLLGHDLLVAPIIREGAKSREVYFPDDRWISIWNGKEYGRGCAEIDAPIGTVPVFYRKNSEYSEIFEKLKEA